MIALLLPAIVACLLIAGIHCYLGLHVVSRGVIFVDLALAQIAVVGLLIAEMLGYEPTTLPAAACAIAAVSLGAAAIAWGRDRRGVVPQEALIGISYAVASAVAILLLDRDPHGQEALKSMLSGSVLYTTWPDVIRMALLYGVVGAIHYALRGRFFAISFGDRPGSAGWDFLFYWLFGVVVFESVQTAGVLLVFSYLVVPAVCAMYFVQGVRPRLFLGWAIGWGGSLLGIGASVRWDLPTGAAIVATFGVVLLVTILASRMARRPPA